MEQQQKGEKQYIKLSIDELIKLFYKESGYTSTKNELEVKFGTKHNKYVKPISRNDYENTIKIIKSFGFDLKNTSDLLRIICEHLDDNLGKFMTNDTVRVELEGLTNIKTYCETNDISTFSKPAIQYIEKKPYQFTEQANKKVLLPTDVDDFNFRVSWNVENSTGKGIIDSIRSKWKSSKKQFRYLNRSTFNHPIYPFKLDLSIVKTGNKARFRNANGKEYENIIPVYKISESNVFQNPETYEIEIELDTIQLRNHIESMNEKKYESPQSLTAELKKIIKYVLSGLQGTMYPVSYLEQYEIQHEYMKCVWKEEYKEYIRINSQSFIGPNSITLQLANIIPPNENSRLPNVIQDFVVTEKADGERHLMYVSKTGKIYLIATNMDVKFTGAITQEKKCMNMLFDGELIKYDKQGKFINLYAAFDIYFVNEKDVRHFPFLEKEEEKAKKKDVMCRYHLLSDACFHLNPLSIEKPKDLPVQCPIRISAKLFYPSMTTTETIFDGCKTILDKQFEYNTDGLIFTHAYYGVGSNAIDKAGPKTKITWDHSFKWKPPQYNTIDFLVSYANGDGSVKERYEYETIVEYKTIELRCGFNIKSGFINPCQNIIDDDIPEIDNDNNAKSKEYYKPVRFYPTDPYDENAGICNIPVNMLTRHMTTLENEIFEDNMIVEFSYDFTKQEGWRWQPLRVRYDKTAKLLRGESEYGNSYKTCNENWKSIHPNGRITEEMIKGEKPIMMLDTDTTTSDNVYYNTSLKAAKWKTQAMKNFHNLYVKKILIKGVSERNDTLIDFACGKAGDLSKWIEANLSFVFGIDYSKDNLENRIDGACVRYLKERQRLKHIPRALFVHGDSGLPIRDGTAMKNDKAKSITNAVFGIGTKDPSTLGKGVALQYGKGANGFNISSCQFAIHYFFKDPRTLLSFLANVSECTKINGFFIGTCYDGKSLFRYLKSKNQGESIHFMSSSQTTLFNDNSENLICSITKEYDSNDFKDDSSCIGYKIKVFQESINQSIDEYLVNYDYLDRLLQMHGFVKIDKAQARKIGLANGVGSFKDLFVEMCYSISSEKYAESSFGNAPDMSDGEKALSFLNNYFIYQKKRNVDVSKINISLEEYQDDVVHRKKEPGHQKGEREVNQDQVKNETDKKERKKKHVEQEQIVVKKLSRKLKLVPATEALETKQNIIIESSSDSDSDNKKT